ncbi:MAG: ATP-binding protein [Coprococcus sp.]
MANFVESSVGIQNCVMIMMEICMAFEMMLILLCVTRFEGLKRIILTVILFASSFFMMAAFQNDHSYSIGKRMNRHVMLPDIPMVLIVCAVTGLMLYLIWNFLGERRREKTLFSQWSVNDAVDNAPCGVCFADTFGRIVLCNSMMWEVSRMLMGEKLQDYDVLHQALQHTGRIAEGVVSMSSTDSVFCFPNGKIWMFQEYLLKDQELAGYKQAIAIDVSELYYNNEKIKANNERLQSLNRKLEEMYEKIGERIREQEILAMKMQVHDNFGRSLLTIRKILENKENMSHMNKQLDVLKEQVYILTNMTVENLEDLYQNTGKHARELGIEIHLEGEAPKNSTYRLCYWIVLSVNV